MALLLVLVGLVLLVQWLMGSGGARSAPTPAAAGSATLAPTASLATDPASGLRWVSLAALPQEASETMDVIASGPPYPYPRADGGVFGNRERRLPARPSGYYHEFTVTTPGSSDRGARRIIAGGPNRGQANQEWYYTDDHYESFVRIRP